MPEDGAFQGWQAIRVEVLDDLHEDNRVGTHDP